MKKIRGETGRGSLVCNNTSEGEALGGACRDEREEKTGGKTRKISSLFFIKSNFVREKKIFLKKRQLWVKESFLGGGGDE